MTFGETGRECRLNCCQNHAQPWLGRHPPRRNAGFRARPGLARSRGSRRRPGSPSESPHDCLPRRRWRLAIRRLQVARPRASSQDRDQCNRPGKPSRHGRTTEFSYRPRHAWPSPGAGRHGHEYRPRSTPESHRVLDAWSKPAAFPQRPLGTDSPTVRI